MAQVVLYRTSVCPYCLFAAKLLQKRGIAFEEINLDGQPNVRAELEERTQWRTVPQIFIGERFVGGYTELAALDRSGELSALVSSPAA